MCNFDKLENLRKLKGISATFLCDLVGRNRGYLKDIKRDGTCPPDSYIKRWAEALGTTYEYLTDQTEYANRPGDVVSDYQLMKALFGENSGCDETDLAKVKEYASLLVLRRFYEHH